MNIKKINSLLLILLGELLIILCFLQFGEISNAEILVLNIIVTSIVYFFSLTDIIFPWINLKDKSQKVISSIGSKWFFTFIYSIFSVGAMIILNSGKNHFSFSSQALIQAIFLFLLLSGLFVSFSSSEKATEIYELEKSNKDNIEKMKKSTNELQIKINLANNIPETIIHRINVLHEDLRFLSPGNKQTIELEIQYIEEIKLLVNYLTETNLNLENISKSINKCEKLFKERKQYFTII